MNHFALIDERDEALARIDELDAQIAEAAAKHAEIVGALEARIEDLERDLSLLEDALGASEVEAAEWRRRYTELGQNVQDRRDEVADELQAYREQLAQRVQPQSGHDRPRAVD